MNVPNRIQSSLPLRTTRTGSMVSGVVAGFSYGKHHTETIGVGFRVGLIGAIVALSVGVVLISGGFWTLEFGSGSAGGGGATAPPVTPSADDVFDSETPAGADADVGTHKRAH